MLIEMDEYTTHVEKKNLKQVLQLEVTEIFFSVFHWFAGSVSLLIHEVIPGTLRGCIYIVQLLYDGTHYLFF